MSHALHIGFASVSGDTGRGFLHNAPDILDMAELVAAFGLAIAAEGAVGHLCSSVGNDGTLSPAFGDTPQLADRTDGAGARVEAIAVEDPDGSPLLVQIVLSVPIDRRQLSRLRLAANVYATRAATLRDARDDGPATGLTPIERQCLSLTLTGRSHLDIGETLDRSAPAVGVHVRRALAKLSADATASCRWIA